MPIAIAAARRARPDRNPLDLAARIDGVDERLQRIESSLDELRQMMEAVVVALGEDIEAASEAMGHRDLQGELMPRERRLDEPL